MNFNITPKKSLTLKPPKYLTKRQTLAYIKGYIDGDGWIYKDKNSVVIGICGTFKVLDWIRKELVGKTNAKIYQRDNHYVLKIYKNSLEVIESLKKLNTFNLERKWEKDFIVKLQKKVKKKKMTH